MYFPYFRGRQYELLALKELAQKKLISQNVIPIVEPIKLSSTFSSTINAYEEAGLPFALVFNPNVGSLAGIDFTTLLPAISKCIIPTVIMQDNTNEIINSLKQKHITKGEILTILNNHDFLNKYKELFLDEDPQYTLFPDERSIRRAISSGKVIFEDKFKKQDKNADYAKNIDEFFSDDHIYFKNESYIGFGDYSIIGNNFDEGGFTPKAVAIHIVYFAADDILRIHHFVSDSNEGIEDVAGKFYEAVIKLAKWYQKYGDARQKTLAIDTLLDYANRGYYPGLPTIKKLSIMHHLELISRFLDQDTKQ